MRINVPWIISRRRFFFAILVDYFLNIFIYSTRYFKDFGVYPNLWVTISLSSFWIVLSYILGRYMICRKINGLEITKTLLKIFFIFVTCNLIYLSINWSSQFIIIFINKSLETINNNGNQNVFFAKTTLLIALFSCIIQFILSILTNKIYSNKKIWIFYGSLEGFKDFKKEVGNIKIFEFQQIDYDFDIKKINFEDKEGIILDNNEEINKYNLDQIFFFKSKGIKVLNVLTWFENKLHRIPPFFIDNKYQIIEKFKLLDDSYIIRIKRIGDFVVSIFLLFITSPLFVLISFCIFIEDQGPTFYSQVRTGFKGEKITIHKFRSMVQDAEKFGPQWSNKGDERITKVGKIIRALRIDELPQLLSVILGHMSLIGPRPERPEIEQNLLNEIPYYEYRNILKPGISGWAQVNYNYAASKEDTIKKLSYDIYYINHVSLFLDLLILIKTIKIIFNAQNHKPKSN